MKRKVTDFSHITEEEARRMEYTHHGRYYRIPMWYRQDYWGKPHFTCKYQWMAPLFFFASFLEKHIRHSFHLKIFNSIIPGERFEEMEAVATEALQPFLTLLRQYQNKPLDNITKNAVKSSINVYMESLREKGYRALPPSSPEHKNAVRGVLLYTEKHDPELVHMHPVGEVYDNIPTNIDIICKVML